MQMHNPEQTNFFDLEEQQPIQPENRKITQLENDTGRGALTVYSVLPGVALTFLDLNLRDGSALRKEAQPGAIEISYCREGRFNCEFQNGDFQYLCAGDLAIHSLSQAPKEITFPLGRYLGISVTVNLKQLRKTLRPLENSLGGLDLDLYQLADKFCLGRDCFVVRQWSAMEQIFQQLYHLPAAGVLPYLKLKVLELLVLLYHLEPEEDMTEKRYFPAQQVETVRAIHDYMLRQLDHHSTLLQLSEQFEIPLTAMKACFKAVYGNSVYAFVRGCRMEYAAQLLRETTDTIADISAKVGYDNSSKFADAFRTEQGMLPSEYRKQCAKQAQTNEIYETSAGNG